jgi:hypothetical protein
MAFKIRRGSDVERLQLSGGTYAIPANGEPLWTSLNQLYVGDGITIGGVLVSGNETYVNLTAMPEDIHGIDAGTTWTGQTMTEVFDAILYPYQAPAFSSFIIVGQSTTLEVGASAATNSITFTWGTTNSANVATNTVDITDTTDAIDHEIDIDDDGTQGPTAYYGVSGVTKTTNTSHVWTIDADNTQAGNFSRTFTVNWRWRFYWGSDAATSMTEALIEGLQNSALYNSIGRTYATNANDYKWMCWPTSLGTASSFTDADTLFSVAMESPETVSVTNTNGETTDYYAYRTTNPTASALNITVA